MEAFARDFGSGIEDIHAGGIAPPRPLAQRRLTIAQETAELFVPTLRALYHVVGKPSEETWPEQALPYAIAFKPPWIGHWMSRRVPSPCLMQSHSSLSRALFRKAAFSTVMLASSRELLLTQPTGSAACLRDRRRGRQ